MYAVSQSYLDYINNDNILGRTVKNKIVIDNEEYFSDSLKTNPKISHTATSFIGGFYSKSCEFEILNLDGSLVLNNKEITVYKGLEFNNTTEWVPMGIFKATDPNITNNESTKSIKFLGYDRAVLFDTPYTSQLDWSTAHTGLEIVQEVCDKLGITLETNNFAFASYSFTSQPNFLEDTLNREVIGRIAEIGGEIAQISRTGGLRIGGQNHLLPKEYTQVDYIQSSGTQYIVTDIQVVDKMTYYLDVEKTDIRENGQYVIGYYNGSYYSPLLLGGGNNQGKIGYAVGNSGWRYTSTILDLNDRHLYKTYLGSDYMQMWQDGVEIDKSVQTRDFGTAGKINLFSYGYNNSQLVNYGFIGKVYQFYAEDINGNKIFDLVPCYRNSDNVIGMYDVISDIFYTNNGTGSFTYGAKEEKGVTGQTVGKRKRISLTKEPLYGPINTVSLGKANIEDDIVYKDDEMIAAAKGKNLYNYSDTANYLYNNGADISLITNGIRATATVAGTYKYATFPIGGEEMLGKTYTLSGIFTPSASNTGAIKAYFLRENGTASSSIAMLTVSDESITFTVPSTMPSDAVSIGLIFYSNDSGTGAIGDYVDYTEVQLEEGSTRTSYEAFFDGVISWRIEDNPYVDLIREDIIEDVASHIIGMSITPFTINGFIDDFIYDLNDVISVIDNEGNTFNAVMLDYATDNRMRSNVGAEAQTEKTINHEIAGSTKQGLNRVSLRVDHNTQQIELLATSVDELNESTTQILQTAESIIMTALQDYVTTGDFETFQTTVSTQFQQTAEDFNFTFNNVIQQINNLDSDTQSQFQEISKYIRFVDGNIVLGEVGNELTLQIENDIIKFLQNDSVVAYLSNNKLYITDGEFLNSLIIGNFALKPRANRNLSLVYIGGDN